MSDELEFKNLKTCDKIIHTNWKVRIEGYDEAITKLNLCTDNNDKILNKYSNLIDKMISDNNVKALEKSLDFVHLFVQRCNITDIMAGDISRGLVGNCLACNRPKTKEKTSELFKVLIEVGKYDSVVPELIKAAESKKPSIILGSVNVLREALREFGPKIIAINDFLDVLFKFFENSDKAVRDAGKEFLIEIFQWIGKDKLSQQLKLIKPNLLEEINREFAKLHSVKLEPSRFIRFDKRKTNSQAKSVTKSVVKNIDKYVLENPVEIISKIPADLYDKIEDKKWTVRKEALEILVKLTNYKKIMAGEYGDLVKILLKVLTKDANVVLVIMALTIFRQLSRGLGKEFAQYSVATIQACLDKFKEKKPTVVSALIECVDSVYETTTLETLYPIIVTALSHKNPTIKLKTALFLNRIFCKSSTDVLSPKNLKQLVMNLIQLSLDNLQSIREATFQVLGTMMKVFGEHQIMKHLDKVDNIRMAKITECYTREEKGDVDTNGSKEVVDSVELDLVENNTCVDGIQQSTLENTVEIEEIENINALSTSFNGSESVSISNHQFEDLKETSRELPELDDKEELDCPAPLNISPPKIKFKITQDADDYKNIMKEIKSLEITHLNSYNQYLDFKENINKIVQQREILFRDPVKSLIFSIYNTDVLTSYCAIHTIYRKNFLDNSLFLKEYGFFLIIVCLQQLTVVIKEAEKLEIGLFPEIGLKSTQDIIYIIKQVISENNCIFFTNDDIILATLVSLRNVAHCIELNTISENFDTVKSVIRLLTVFIIEKTADLPVYNMVTCIATEILLDNNCQGDFRYNIDLPGIIKTLFDEHIRRPAECKISLNKKDVNNKDNLEHARLYDSVETRINRLLLKVDLYGNNSIQ